MCQVWLETEAIVLGGERSKTGRTNAVGPLTLKNPQKNKLKCLTNASCEL